jgi:hypothetical protein
MAEVSAGVALVVAASAGAAGVVKPAADSAVVSAVAGVDSVAEGVASAAAEDRLRQSRSDTPDAFGNRTFE